MTPDRSDEQRPATLPRDGTAEVSAVIPDEAERRRRLALGI